MKNKFRKIVIEDFQYLYTLTDKYHSENQTNTLTIRIFLKDYKQNALVLDFLTIDHPYMGQILKSGVALKNILTDTVDIVNLNEPKYIRQLILHAKKNGWQGHSKIDKQDGLSYLAALGYEVQILIPNQSKSFHEL
ncbi:hypothetical protein ACFFLS_18940 [Flavobacterium procerum]|uniref:Uncharacterized protein n=1 Tax=Flavobacterium procerum TaxID=1455569 RepID=A0ABV6BUK9_9FLAO